MSSDRAVNQLEASISLVRSVCSHQRSSALSKLTVLPSSGVSRLILHTLSGTGKQKTIFYRVSNTKLFYKTINGKYKVVFTSRLLAHQTTFQVVLSKTISSKMIKSIEQIMCFKKVNTQRIANTFQLLN